MNIQPQYIDFCGLYVNHQNSIAEHYISTNTELERTMLIHTMISWPDIIQEMLQPFTLFLAIFLHNTTPGPRFLRQEEMFSCNKGQYHLTNFHPFGCPLFVLELPFNKAIFGTTCSQHHNWTHKPISTSKTLHTKNLHLTDQIYSTSLKPSYTSQHCLMVSTLQILIYLRGSHQHK